MTITQKITYLFLNTLAKVVFSIYFRRIRVEGRTEIPKGLPLVVAPNHPNTMGDPVLMATIMPARIHFLANYGLFKHPVTKFLMSKVFFSIPVKRRKDMRPGETVNNLATIKACVGILSKGGSVFMGPEATSYAYRRVRPLKDGIARISLSAAKRGKFQSGLTIVPVGTNYSSPSHFRSEIICRVGQPIHLDDFRQMYRKDKSAAAAEIMCRIRSQLESLTIHTTDEEENRFLQWCETLAIGEGLFRDFEGRLAFAQSTLPRIRALRAGDAPSFEGVWRVTRDYFQRLQKYNTDDRALLQGVPPTYHTALLWLAMPFYLMGCLLNAVWFLPAWAFRKMGIYEGYATMVKILVGLVSIPLYYTLAIIATAWCWGGWGALFFIAAATLTGIFILPYGEWRAGHKKRKAVSVSKRAVLLEKRRAVLKVIRNAGILQN